MTITITPWVPPITITLTVIFMFLRWFFSSLARSKNLYLFSLSFIFLLYDPLEQQNPLGNKLFSFVPKTLDTYFNVQLKSSSFTKTVNSKLFIYPGCYIAFPSHLPSPISSLCCLVFDVSCTSILIFSCSSPLVLLNAVLPEWLTRPHFHINNGFFLHVLSLYTTPGDKYRGARGWEHRSKICSFWRFSTD